MTRTPAPSPLTAAEQNGAASRTPGRGLTRKAYLNGVAAVLDYVARLVVGFVVNPLLVSGLGDILYGLWQVLSRSMGYMSAASGRTPQALKATIAYQQSSDDLDAKRRSVGSAVVVWLLFTPLLGAAGAMFAWQAPRLFDLGPDAAGPVRLAIALLTVNLVAMSLADIPRAVLNGENLGYKRMGLSAALVVAGGAFTALAVLFRTGLPGVAAAQVATTVLSGAVFLHVVRVHVRWFGVARPTVLAGRRFLGLSGWFVTWRLVMQAMIASDVVVLGLMTRMELVTTYTLTKYTADTLLGLAAIIVTSVAPGLGGIIGAGDLGKARRVRGEVMATTWLVTTTAGTALLLWNRSFVELWVGPRYYAGLLPMLTIVLMMMQFVFIRNDALMIDLTLNVRRKVVLGIAAAAASVLAAATLLRLGGGIVGLCVGLMTGRAMLTLAYPWLLGRFLEASPASQLRSALRPALVTAALFLLAIELQADLSVQTWSGLVAGAGLTVVASFVVAMYGGLAAAHRRRVLERVWRLAPRG